MLRSGKEKRKEMAEPDLEDATLQRRGPLESELLQGERKTGPERGQERV